MSTIIWWFSATGQAAVARIVSGCMEVQKFREIAVSILSWKKSQKISCPRL
jgi:hypothetical protein